MPPLAGTEAPEVVGPHAVQLGKALTSPLPNRPARSGDASLRNGFSVAINKVLLL